MQLFKEISRQVLFVAVNIHSLGLIAIYQVRLGGSFLRSGRFHFKVGTTLDGHEN